MVTRPRRLHCLVPALIAALASWTATDLTAAEEPWEATWTMDLQGEERAFVDHLGESYLLVAEKDFDDPLFLNRKDIVLRAKFAGQQGDQPRFFNLSRIAVAGQLDALNAAASGDNLYLLGRIEATDGNRYRLTIAHILTAPSDATIIADRLATVASDDYNGRIEVARWARERSEQEGNRAFWTEASLDIVRTTARAAAARAEATGDGAFLLMAMDFAIQEAGDRTLAAELGTAEWVRTSESAEMVTARMQELGFVFHEVANDEFVGWLPKNESLVRAFEARYQAIDWRDAEAFFELGSSTDELVDVLPRARELSHRAFQAGFRANPNHNGIRRALGLEPVDESVSQGPRVVEARFFHASTGVMVTGPDGWVRDDTAGGTVAHATWIDRLSDTAFISVRVFDPAFTDGDMQVAWDGLVGDVQLRPDFAAGATSEEAGDGGTQIRRMGYTHTESDYQRSGVLTLVYDPAQSLAVGINASYVGDEEPATLTGMQQVLDNIVLPIPSPEVPEGEVEQEETIDADQL